MRSAILAAAVLANAATALPHLSSSEVASLMARQDTNYWAAPGADDCQ